MAFDFKKEYKELYMPPRKPVIIDVPQMNYVAIRGKGDPNKEDFEWIAMIRLPDFITKADFEWAVRTAAEKKKLDCSKAEFFTLEEGICVQIMHIGSYDNEPASVEKMDRFIEEQGYVNDISAERQHHEIYLSDPRKTEADKLKTVIRHPIKKRK